MSLITPSFSSFCPPARETPKWLVIFVQKPQTAWYLSFILDIDLSLPTLLQQVLRLNCVCLTNKDTLGNTHLSQHYTQTRYQENSLALQVFPDIRILLRQIAHVCLCECVLLRGGQNIKQNGTQKSVWVQCTELDQQTFPLKWTSRF